MAAFRRRRALVCQRFPALGYFSLRSTMRAQRRWRRGANHSNRIRCRLFGRSHRARGRTRRKGRYPVSRVRMSRRTHGGAGAAGADEESGQRLRSAAGRADARGAAALRRQRHQDRHQYGRGQPGSRGAQDRRDREIARAVRAEDRRRRRRRRARCLQGRRSADHGIRRHHQAARQPAAVGQCLSRRRADGAGADVGRRYRHHRPRVRSGAVPGADDPCLRLGDGRLESARAGHRRRASAGMRRPDHRRLFCRSRLQGRSRSRAARFSDRRSRRGRQSRHHQGRGLRRRGDGADLQGAIALRGARSQQNISSRTWSRISRR